MTESKLTLQELVDKVQEEDHYLYVSEERWLIECPDSNCVKICSAQPCAGTSGGSGFKCNTPIAVETEDGEIVPCLESTAQDCRNNTG